MDLETATTRQLICLIIACSLGLVFASLAMGCAPGDRLAYSKAEWHYYTKDQDRWSGGGP